MTYSTQPTNQDPHAAPETVDVVVVGAGLAGLTASAFAAKAGASVLRLEARRHDGGRAVSDDIAGFRVDRGPHALYRRGAAHRIADELGVALSGGMPKPHRYGWIGDGSWRSLLRPAALGGVRGLAASARMVRRGEAARWRGATMADWLEAQPASARPALAALVRLATYTVRLEGLDAEAGLTQMRRAAGSVDYLDDGWQSLVDGFRRAATTAGATAAEGKVTVVTPGPRGWRVSTADGRHIDAAAVVFANGGSGDAARLLEPTSPTLQTWAAEATPVVAACRSYLLRDVPPRRLGGYGLGEPVYSIAMSASARQAPKRHVLVQSIYYQPDLVPEVEPLQRLDAALDTWLPDWRDRLIQVVDGRRLVVAHDQARPGGNLPTAEVPDLAGIWLAGDAITTDGLLADAAVSSGRTAGLAAAAWSAERTAPDTLAER